MFRPQTYAAVRRQMGSRAETTAYLTVLATISFVVVTRTQPMAKTQQECQYTPLWHTNLCTRFHDQHAMPQLHHLGRHLCHHARVYSAQDQGISMFDVVRETDPTTRNHALDRIL